MIQWYVGLATTPTLTSIRAAQHVISTGHLAVARASAGGYVNYVESGRSIPSYYGGSLTRLRAVKQKYDPGNFFRTGFTYS